MNGNKNRKIICLLKKEGKLIKQTPEMLVYKISDDWFERTVYVYNKMQEHIDIHGIHKYNILEIEAFTGVFGYQVNKYYYHNTVIVAME